MKRKFLVTTWERKKLILLSFLCILSFRLQFCQAICGRAWYYSWTNFWRFDKLMRAQEVTKLAKTRRGKKWKEILYWCHLEFAKRISTRGADAKMEKILCFYTRVAYTFSQFLVNQNPLSTLPPYEWTWNNVL